MSGDYSRQRFDARKDYRGVLLQQGRVQLDADWNEQVDLTNRLARATTLDTIGRCIVPSSSPSAFQISWANDKLVIGPGRMYVDGIMIENHGTGSPQFDPALAEMHASDALPLSAQPYGTPTATLPGPGRFLVYVDVWQREVTALEEPQLVESALGFDTTTRLQAVWQVRIHPTPMVNETCATPDDQMPGWSMLTSPSSGRLSTFIEEQPSEAGPCILPPTPGYRGLDNRLYRVQIHSVEAGELTFKWSRDNASCGTNVVSVDDAQSIVVDDLGRDADSRFKPGDWLELLTDADEFAFRPGAMRKIESIDIPSRQIRLQTPVSDVLPDTSREWLSSQHVRVRRWDQRGPEVDAGSGVLKVKLDGSRQQLEDGIEIVFHLAGTGNFHVGDYWLFAARAVDRSVEMLDQAIPRGIHHHYGRLAIVQAPSAVSDCRQLWPLPHLALRYLGGDGQQGPPGNELPCPLIVGVEDQRARPQAGVLVRFSDQGSGDTLIDVNDMTNNGASIVVKTDENGRARVRRILGKPIGCHDVEVRLESAPPQGTALRLTMEARAVGATPSDKLPRLNRVLIAGKPFANDRVVLLVEFMKGVFFEFNEPMSPLCFANQIPAGQSILTLPNPNAVVFSLELVQQEQSPDGIYFGHRILILGGTFEPDGQSDTGWVFRPRTISPKLLERWISEHDQFGSTKMIRCRMVLKGNFLFDKSGERHLDSEAFTTFQDFNGDRTPQFEELSWSPSGDGRPGGTIEGWFWLTNRQG